jgi:GNAT superfamily N-acetyltransferase
METGQLIVDANPAAEDVAFLDDRINEFNFAATQIYDGRALASFVRDANGQIIAGIYGWTWGGCGYIDKLWVQADARGQGYGTRLLEVFEREALGRGCFQLLLSTHSFQAPEFYRRLGYAIYGVAEDYPRGYQQYYLRKTIEQPQ